MKKIALMTIIAVLMLMPACTNKKYINMNADDFETFISTADVQLVDVRTAEEYAEGHINGAVLLDVKRDDFIANAFKVLNKDKPVAVYCRSGKRSANAADQLTRQGFKVANLKDGIIGWTESGKPVVVHEDVISDEEENEEN